MTTSGTTNDEWYDEWQQVTLNDSKWQQITMSNNKVQQAVTNENSTAHFKEWMIAILSMTKNRCTTLTDG